MRQLSSATSKLFKWINASAMVFLGISLLVGATRGFGDDRAWVYPAMLVFFLYAGASFFFYEWPMADAVYDTGDGLVVRRRSVEEKFLFKDIQGVEAWQLGTTRHMTVRFARDNPLGKQIRFRPADSIRGNELDELNRRIREARIRS